MKGKNNLIYILTAQGQHIPLSQQAYELRRSHPKFTGSKCPCPLSEGMEEDKVQGPLGWASMF